MALDRDDTLKKAEKLLRQGRLEGAIAEYSRVLEDQPRDWATTNMLGDLYVRAGQVDKATAQYGRVAEHFMTEGFYQKAAALYKKILKLSPQDEASQLNLAEMSFKLGLLADAKSHFHAVAARRRSREDHAGAAMVVIRLGSIDPADFDARSAAARTLAEMGNQRDAAERFRKLYDDLTEKERPAEGLAALREAVRLNPSDRGGRVTLALAAIRGNDLEAAREYLDRETAADDPTLLTALVELELKSGRLDSVRELLPQLMALGPEALRQLLDALSSSADRNPEETFSVVEAIVDAALARGEFPEAAAILRQFVSRAPNQIPALLKLIEVCVDGGLESHICEAQAGLADAYLAAGQASEARFIAEDLVAREPWESGHIDRFRRALIMLKVPEPDAVIAERLSGQTPFTATDPFAAHDASADFAADDDESVSAEAAATEFQAASSSGQEAGPPTRPGAVPDADPATPEQARGRLEKAFTDFRSEIERQSGVDQSAQHMTLARTYLEMGMPNEALGSLHVASRAPRFRFEAASLLGRIYRERGENAQAIEWLERAAEAPAPNADQGRALLYDLGALVEARGETARALAIFLELQSDAGEYRDVAQRVERLTRVETGG